MPGMPPGAMPGAPPRPVMAPAPVPQPVAAPNLSRLGPAGLGPNIGAAASDQEKVNYCQLALSRFFSKSFKINLANCILVVNTIL